MLFGSPVQRVKYIVVETFDGYRHQATFLKFE